MAASGQVVGAGAVGAVGGVGVSLAILDHLPVKEIMSGATNLSPAYPIAFFGMVSLFMLVSALFLTSIPDDRRKLVNLGVVVFAAIAMGGVGVILYDVVTTPTIKLSAFIEPAPTDFHDPDGVSPVRMQVFYNLPDTEAKMSPLVGQMRVRKGQPVRIRLEGFADLTGKYGANYQKLVTLQQMLDGACARNRANSVCDTLHDYQGVGLKK